MPAAPPSLLLVHGAWHGAWCWEQAFAPYLRDQGLRVHSLDLPGHGRPGPARIGWPAIADYVDAVEARLQGLEGPVVVAGHSMGGFITQKLMERRPPQLAGAVLMAAATPRGVLGVVGHLVRTRPVDFLLANLRLDLYHLVRRPELSGAMFYSPELPAAEVEQHWQHLSNESYRAFLDMLGLAAPRPARADPALPKLVLGGERDLIFPPAIVERTAAAYGTQARIYPRMGHNLMQDIGWEQVAADLAEWLRSLGPCEEEPRRSP